MVGKVPLAGLEPGEDLSGGAVESQDLGAVRVKDEPDVSKPLGTEPGVHLKD